MKSRQVEFSSTVILDNTSVFCERYLEVVSVLVHNKFVEMQQNDSGQTFCFSFVVAFTRPGTALLEHMKLEVIIYWNIRSDQHISIKLFNLWFISTQVNSNQPITAAVTASIFEVVLVRDLASRGVEMEALDVPGKADEAVGDASASSIESSAGVVSLGAEEGWLVVKLSIHSLRPASSACSRQHLDNSHCRSFECPAVQSVVLLSQMHDSVVLP
jgi:hypothetical protein